MPSAPTRRNPSDVCVSRPVPILHTPFKLTWIAISTSVSKLAQALANEFSNLCGNVKFSHNYHGSSDAYKKTQGTDKDSTGYFDMAFASRDFKLDSSEQAVEGTYGALCIDAIVPVVNLENTCSQITKDQLVKMYTGVYTKWNEIK